jgi:tetratricopeptide (TPR) repeat protein
LETVRQLEKAASLAPSEAAVWNDLAAAYYVRAQRFDEPLDLLRALESADRAIELSPETPSSLFNRALVLEHLFLRGEAREAWNRYLRSERDAGWRAEARGHLRALDRSGAESWERSLPAVTWTALAGNHRVLPEPPAGSRICRDLSLPLG